MEFEDVEVGKVYKVKDGKICGNFRDMQPEAVAIKITEKIGDTSSLRYQILNEAGNVIISCWGCILPRDIIRNSNYSNKNMLDKFLTNLKPEPEKTFIKTGITDTNGVLTPDGQKVFMGWLLQKNKVDFADGVAIPLLAEIESEK